MQQRQGMRATIYWLLTVSWARSRVDSIGKGVFVHVAMCRCWKTKVRELACGVQHHINTKLAIQVAMQHATRHPCKRRRIANNHLCERLGLRLDGILIAVHGQDGKALCDLRARRSACFKTFDTNRRHGNPKVELVPIPLNVRGSVQSAHGWRNEYRCRFVQSADSEMLEDRPYELCTRHRMPGFP